METGGIQTLINARNNPLQSGDSFHEREKLWLGSNEKENNGGGGRGDQEDSFNDDHVDGRIDKGCSNNSQERLTLGSDFFVNNEELSETFQVLEEKIHQINNQMKTSSSSVSVGGAVSSMHQDSCKKIDDPNFDKDLGRNRKGNVQQTGQTFLKSNLSFNNNSRDGGDFEGFRQRIEEEKRKRAEESRGNGSYNNNSNNDTGNISLDSQKM